MAIIPTIIISPLTLHCYVTQMRSVNNYSRYSSWSTPVVVNLSDITVTAPPAPTVEPQEQFPTYAYSLIGVSLLILLAVLAVVMYLCISYVRKHYFVNMVSINFDVNAYSIIIVVAYSL